MDLFLKCVNNRFTLCMVTFFLLVDCEGLGKLSEVCTSSSDLFVQCLPVFKSIHSSFHQWLQDWLQHSMVKAIPMLNSWTSILLMKVLIHFFPPSIPLLIWPDEFRLLTLQWVIFARFTAQEVGAQRLQPLINLPKGQSFPCLSHLSCISSIP